MTDIFLQQIDYLITAGNDVMATRQSKSTPAQTITARDVMGELYNQRHVPATKSEFVDNAKYVSWRTDVLAYLQNHFNRHGNFYIESIHDIAKTNWQTNHTAAKTMLEVLSSFRDKVSMGIVQPDSVITSSNGAFNLNIIFDRFHDVARELRTRHYNRATLSVDDEYDVQDLLRALLRLYFKDIREEEWTTSFAGASARMDFLLKAERIVIEVKRTRKSLTAKKLGDELIEDITRYRTHPDCDKLICFVYDPEGLLGNPQGIINDLSTQNEGFVEVIIKP